MLVILARVLGIRIPKHVRSVGRSYFKNTNKTRAGQMVP